MRTCVSNVNVYVRICIKVYVCAYVRIKIST